MITTEKIGKLQSLLKENNIAAYIIGDQDPHMSEYVAKHWKSRSWLTGFTGSAGICVVTQNSAGLWTDSRYFIEAAQSLKGSGITLFKMGEKDVPTYSKWLQDNLKEESCVALDGKIWSNEVINNLKKTLKKGDIKLDSSHDFIASLWEDRPALPQTKIFIHAKKYSGKSCNEKLCEVRKKMKEEQATHYIVGALDEIAWLFNVRANDVHCNPVTISYALVTADSATLFVDPKKMSKNVQSELINEGVSIDSYDAIFTELQKLDKSAKVLFVPAKTNQKLCDSLRKEVKLLKEPAIVNELKGIKNSTEQDGFKQALIYDGAAMINFYYWLEQNLGKEKITEITVAEKLIEFRSEQPLNRGPSFDTIAGYKDHAALCHYSATPETAYELKEEGMLLIDSGGQYLCGTTDTTRTTALGKVSDEEKLDFTLVLKGHINLSMAIFPEKTKGVQLDLLARLPLWQHQQNFLHGTGHGIGCFLNVHEGPHNIGPGLGKYPIAEGTVTTNEPGLYKEGKHGIRLENILLAKKHSEGEFGTFLCFESITLCPFDTTPLLVDMLTDAEKVWLNNYHQEVFEKVAPLLEAPQKEWLKDKTKLI